MTAQMFFDSVWAQLGAVGLLSMFVLAMLTGRLIPRRVMKDLVDRADNATANYRAAAEASDRRADETVALMHEVLTALHTVEELVRTKGPV